MFEVPKIMKSVKKNVDYQKDSLPKTDKKERKKERVLRSHSPIFASGVHLALFSEKLSGALVALAEKGAPL